MKLWLFQFPTCSLQNSFHGNIHYPFCQKTIRINTPWICFSYLVNLCPTNKYVLLHSSSVCGSSGQIWQKTPWKLKFGGGKQKKKKKGGLYSARETFLNWILCCALQGLFFSFFPFHLKLVNLGPVVGKEGFAPLDLWVYYEHGRVRLSAHWWMLHLWADYQFKHIFTHKTKQVRRAVAAATCELISIWGQRAGKWKTRMLSDETKLDHSYSEHFKQIQLCFSSEKYRIVLFFHVFCGSAHSISLIIKQNKRPSCEKKKQTNNLNRLEFAAQRWFFRENAGENINGFKC